MTFPKAPGLPKDKKAYLRFIDEIYQHDAYHSLSIEGYSSHAGADRAGAAGDWDPDHHDEDRKSRDALAARGYWQAFQLVKGTVADVHRRGNPARSSARRTRTGIANCSSPALRRV